jgi:exportin-2 (importin alpha re-exporter)
MLGISVRKESSLGVSETNDAVDVMAFFNSHILPELQDTNHAARPVVKATALKFVTTFRNQFSRDQHVALMPLLISHLGSPPIVVHTFAAFAIERSLVAKEEVQGGGKVAKVGKAELKTFLEPLFNALFNLVDNAELNENDYVMKCVMRALAVAQEDVVPITQILIEKLTSALARVAKNPRNPQFNHFLFESIAVLVRSVCAKDASATPGLEGLLFPPFETILQLDILEFTPYVFQVLAQLLEYRSTEGGLGQYEGLFRPLLTPALWERKGNVPALTRLVQAYLLKAAPELVAAGHLVGILGCFQKLLSAPATEADAFNLLNSLVIYVPHEAMKQYLGTIFQLLLTRLQGTKQARSEVRYNRFSKLMIHFLALFLAKFGSQPFFDELEAIQPGVALSLIVQVWLPKLQADPPKASLDGKVQVLGLTRLLCETPNLLNDSTGQQLWCSALGIVVTVLTSPSMKTDPDADVDLELVTDMQYDSAFSGLTFAKRQVVDPFAEVSDPSIAFVTALHRVMARQPGRLLPLIQEGLKHDPKLSPGLETMFQKAGLRLA